MKKFASLVALAAVTAFPAVAFAETAQVREPTEAAASPAALTAGKMLYAADGGRIAPVYRVTAEGNPQVIMNGRLVTVPASSLSDVGGKVTSSLSKKDIASAK
ncbi:hypothetical protein [Novosphingobium sp. P6W]|uniref:hypothetical protein n=1 Tax=Novosphingobium sp. P6W TaxID=1609758 RepID=UPI0005C3173D|nr:hypothetical protein [Novosphingobium sp. P6W]AXB76910.1 hypothetical protein TQ38_010725 [Novosphingobium sp. P6W]KIS33248.1 hypothetical protein TQ38_07405 [Novosphingobium sp. P6W]